MTRKSKKWSIFLLAACAVGVAVGYLVRNFDGTGDKSPQSYVVTAEAGQPIGAILYYAQSQALFREQGIYSTLLPFTSGRDALTAVVNGEAHLATVADTPIVNAILIGHDLKIIATIGTTSKGLAIIGKKEKLNTPSDLMTLKIGYTPGTNSEYFLQAYMVRHDMDYEQASTVPMPPEEMLSSLGIGTVDAVSTWQPHIARITTMLGTDAVVFYSSGIYDWTWNLVGRSDYVKNNQDTLTNFLKALLRSKELIDQYPTNSQGVIANFLRIDPKMLDMYWSDLNLNVALDQALIVNLESQALWRTKNNRDYTIPDFSEAIDANLLKSQKPLNVSLIE